jgi:RNA polymerase sigma-54 factor
VPTAELEARIEEELESNPALEEGDREDYGNDISTSESESNDTDIDLDNQINEGINEYDLEAGEKGQEEYDTNENNDYEYDYDDINVGEYLMDDDISGYKMQGDGPVYDEEEREIPIVTSTTLAESLMAQLGYLNLSDKELAIGRQLIGSIDDDGYIRREIDAIVNDFAYWENIDTTKDEVEKVLFKIQSFDPPGIAARSLQECLVLQLQRKDANNFIVQTAIKLLTICFEEFTKKHYPKIERRLNITEDDLKDAVSVIVKLNPKPGGNISNITKSHYLTPDFILRNNNGKLELSLNSKNAPDLKISRSYADMLDAYDKSDKKDKKMKQTITFVKQKLDAAKWFIDAIKQRQQTLLKTMNAIVGYQKEFFREGDESKLRPMILKDIANEISMDISTVSRVANSKTVQTDFGIYPLKYFFSESISTDTGEDVSSKEVKYILKEIIDSEDKRKPYSDDKLEKMLNDKGYNIARRTVAKYREQMNIPVARLRKEL